MTHTGCLLFFYIAYKLSRVKILGDQQNLRRRPDVCSFRGKITWGGVRCSGLKNNWISVSPLIWFLAACIDI